MSNWEQRPLSSKQIEYAALDALVLLDIFDVITRPQNGLKQQELQPLIYSYTGQRRQRSGDIGSQPAGHLSQRQQDPSSSETVRSHADAEADNQASAATDPQQEGIEATASTKNAASGSKTSTQHDHRQHTISLPAGGRQHQAAHDASPPNTPSCLPAQTPLQRCLQHNRLQHTAHSIAPGTG